MKFLRNCYYWLREKKGRISFWFSKTSVKSFLIFIIISGLFTLVLYLANQNVVAGKNLRHEQENSKIIQDSKIRIEIQRDSVVFENIRWMDYYLEAINEKEYWRNKCLNYDKKTGTDYINKKNHESGK